MTETTLALPNESESRQAFLTINKFQEIVRANMKRDLDYGIIPGTSGKPTLLKPGAEKIAKILGLADQYEIMDKSEDWDKPFFRYLIRCSLVGINSTAIVSQGLGECNSMESKYRYRWVFPSALPPEVDKNKLLTRLINTRNGKVKQYRLPNEDIYSQVNTILKMAKKRALVDAALSAGRLSELFTQDIEDMESASVEDIESADSGYRKAESRPKMTIEYQPPSVSDEGGSAEETAMPPSTSSAAQSSPPDAGSPSPLTRDQFLERVFTKLPKWKEATLTSALGCPIDKWTGTWEEALDKVSTLSGVKM